MIVEFCGIPGGGKSTTISRYTSKYPQSVRFITIDMYKRSPVLLYGGLFILRHPISFFWLFLFVVRFHMRGLFPYSLHLAIRACAKYQKASLESKSDILFIDEGLVHVLCTISSYNLDEENIKLWLNRIVMPDALCFATDGTFHRFHREDKLGNPRVAKGNDALLMWENSVRFNTALIYKNLDKKKLKVWQIPEEKTSSAGAESLHTFLNSL